MNPISPKRNKIKTNCTNRLFFSFINFFFIKKNKISNRCSIKLGISINGTYFSVDTPAPIPNKVNAINMLITHNKKNIPRFAPNNNSLVLLIIFLYM